MKAIILTLALLSFAISGSSARAAGNSGYNALQREYKAQQAQQEAINSRLAKIDRDAAQDISGIPEQESAGAYAGPSGLADRRFCVDKC
jgi:hypothetical protein